MRITQSWCHQIQLDPELLFVFMLRKSTELLQDYNPTTALNSTYYEDCRLYLEYILGHNATFCIFLGPQIP